MSNYSDNDMNLEDLIGKQKLSFGRLKKLKVNYGKDGETRKTKHYMKNKIESLQEEWNSIRSTQQDIMHQFSAADSKLDYFKNDVYGEIRELYVEIISELEQFQEEKYGSENVNPQVIPNNHIEDTRPKLPTINLPKFNGEYQCWTSFRDLFVTLIHDNADIPDVHKLYYLKTHITGEAESLLSNVTIADANYQNAWRTLQDRYENKRILVNTQLSKLLNQKPLIFENAEGIKGLLDNTSECLKALQNLEMDTTSWDPIMVFLTTQKLPRETHEKWEHSISNSKDLPSFASLAKFLEARFRTIEAVSTLHGNKSEKAIPSKTDRHNKQKDQVSYQRALHIVQQNKCFLCNEQHSIRQCSKYRQMEVARRLQTAKNKKLCLNCLGTGHIAKDCRSTHNCSTCGKRYHSLLHEEASKNQNKKINEVTTTTTNHTNSAVSMHCALSKEVLLATALVQIATSQGVHTLRALLDQGSQVSFITEAAVQTLKLPKENIQVSISGVGQSIEKCRSKVKLDLINRENKALISTDALVIRSITKFIPRSNLSHQEWPHLKGLELADPKFLHPGKIDILLGADVYANVLCEGLQQGPPNTPIAQNTIFGWIISGRTENLSNKQTRKTTCFNVHHRLKCDDILRRFWEIEETPITRTLNEEENKCESIFKESHQRDISRRYIVHLPFKENKVTPDLGKSRPIALGRFIQAEKRLLQNKHLKEQYTKCINEYRDLNHMRAINSVETQHCNEINGKSVYTCYYLPHHPVLKEDSSTTKLRVVFNASQQTENGKSLNDLLMTGPAIQDDLKAILFRWRFHKYAYSADIEKMYRQVGVIREHEDYQRILWRPSPKQKIKEYCLTRLTFGFTSAAFLAIRAMQQLVYDEGHNFPLVKNIILKDFYVDNVLSGADTIIKAKEQRKQLIKLLAKGGFPLKKWSSSDDGITLGLTEDYLEGSKDKDLTPTEDIKTLGVLWNPKEDYFGYKFGIEKMKKISSKREAASIIGKVFDPLGWCAPVTVVGKIILQSLWLLELGWDDELPKEIIKKFQNYQHTLQQIDQIKIPRWTGTSSETKYEMHGFCDASNKAYAAVIYLRILQPNGETKITLLAARTKVAPIKTISLPRLELCGALLLSRLCKYYVEAMEKKPTIIYAWTDSTIVLSWLNGSPNKWKCFVANRVSEIKQMINRMNWRHVSSKENPADCASRGINASDLCSHELWWTGPKWLKQDYSNWPKNKLFETREELKNAISLTVQISMLPSFMTKFSKLRTLIRVTAYVYRFVNNCRKSNRQNTTIWLSSEELKVALSLLIKTQQRTDFKEEIKMLKKGRNLSTSSRITKLHPFIDMEGLLRVGGRLHNADLAYSEKHPLILHSKGAITKLIMQHTHLQTLHGGPQLTLNRLKQGYWIIHARSTVRHLINQCVICIRQKGNCKQQLMGSLPPSRVLANQTFSHTGVDYCGPFNIKLASGRGLKCQKSYVAIFICLATKAIHIELVSDLTTVAFMAAFRRFVARQGKPSDMYSDCGTNFLGASRVMNKELQNLIKIQQPIIAESLANEQTSWHFNPPAAPNFGGLWEAGVKSTKYHLKRLINDKMLTYEEMSTVLHQIEACLNSRPLSPMTNDIEDITALTPGHFLIGKPLQSIPEESRIDEKENRLDKWHRALQISQHFWQRWHQEYLHHLQQRGKWSHSTDNIAEGDLVIIKEPNLPANTWLLGRVVKVYPDNMDKQMKMKELFGSDSEEEATRNAKGYFINNKEIRNLDLLRPSKSIAEMKMRLDNDLQKFITREGETIFIPKHVLKRLDLDHLLNIKARTFKINLPNRFEVTMRVYSDGRVMMYKHKRRNIKKKDRKNETNK